MKVVINRCYGGFGLSEKAMLRMVELGHLDSKEEMEAEYPSWIDSYGYDVTRDNPILVQVVEELGIEANGGYAKLKVVEVPDDVDWFIHNYDGLEHIAENHRSWH